MKAQIIVPSPVEKYNLTAVLTATPFERRLSRESRDGRRFERLSLSRTVSRSVLNELGQRFLKHYPLSEADTVCFVTVASSGFTLASALAESAGPSSFHAGKVAVCLRSLTVTPN